MAILPASGEWHLSNPLFGGNPPFAVLAANFIQNRGTARYLQNTFDLRSVVRIAPDRFGATYAVGRNSGLFEARIDNDQILRMKFIGTVQTECKARPIEGRIFGAVRIVSAMTNAEKLGEAMKRARPLLPAEVGEQLDAMLTPEALATMAAILTVWAASHAFGVGEIADAVLLVAGAAMLGAGAVGVARDIFGFVTTALGAKSEAELDAAARHFAGAVIKGGLTVVMALLLRRGAKATQERLDARFAPRPPAPRAPAGRLVPGAPPNARLPAHLEPLKDPIAAARAATADCEGQALHLKGSLGPAQGAQPPNVVYHGTTTAGGEAIDHAWATTRMAGVDYVLDTSAAQYIKGSPICTTAPLLEPSQIIAAGLAEAVETGVFTRAQHQAFLSLLQRSRVPRRPG